MRFPAKLLISLLALIVFVPVVALTGVKIALESPSVSGILLTSVEQTLGMPVSYRSVSFTLCGGIRLKGVLAEHGDEATRFSAESMTLYPDYAELMQGRFVIREIDADHPTAQIPLSGWPARPSEIPPTSFPANTIQKTPSSHPTSPQTTGSRPLFSPSTSATAVFPGAFPRLRMSDAVITLLSDKNLPLLSAQGVELSGEKSLDGSWSGPLKIRQLAVVEGIILRNLEADLFFPAISPSLLLKNLTATLGGGKLGGEFTCALPPSTPNYALRLNLTQASLPEFFSDASLGHAATEGAVSGDLQLSGIAGLPQSVSGKGQLLCHGAVLQPADFLKQIGQILQIQELQLLRIPEGKFLFQIQRGELQVDQLSLQSENLILTAQGPVHANGDLDLQARLLFNEQLTARLRGLLGSQLTRAPEPGFSQVAFHVSGPAKNPRTDLLERLTGIRINGDLGGFLQGLFGRPTNR